MTAQKLVLINRAVPGSGKTTITKHIVQHFEAAGLKTAVHSTDDYFIGEDGLYHFDKDKLKEFHQQNISRFRESISKKINLVVCDNTNLSPWESRPYTEAARGAGYMIGIIDFLPRDPIEHIKAQQPTPKKPDAHQVPEKVILMMIIDYYRYRNHLSSVYPITPGCEHKYLRDAENLQWKSTDEKLDGYDADWVYTIDPDEYHSADKTLPGKIMRWVGQQQQSAGHHHIMMASTEIWPNILGLMRLHHAGTFPDTIHILHSDNEEISKLPAKNLRWLTNKTINPGTKIILHPIGDGTPTAIGSTIDSIRKKAPSGTRWTVNITGGSKIHFAGILPQIHAPRTTVYYRETNHWITLSAPDGKRPHQPCTVIREDNINDSTARIPLTALLNANLPDRITQNWEWQADPLPEIPPAKLQEIIRHAIKTKWEWGLLPDKFPEIHPKNDGNIFEQIFAALLRPFLTHSHQGGINAKLVDTDFSKEIKNAKSTKEEIDVVVNSGSRILIFDLKTSKPQLSVVDQYTKVASDLRRCGGRQSYGVIVRPQWNAETHERLTEHFKNISLWHAENISGIIPMFAELLDRDIPAELAPVHELLKNSKKAFGGIHSSNAANIIIENAKIVQINDRLAVKYNESNAVFINQENTPGETFREIIRSDIQEKGVCTPINNNIDLIITQKIRERDPKPYGLHIAKQRSGELLNCRSFTGTKWAFLIKKR